MNMMKLGTCIVVLVLVLMTSPGDALSAREITSKPQDCLDANWRLSFDKLGWSTCGNDDKFITGFFRSQADNYENDGIHNLQLAKCCSSSKMYAGQCSKCQHGVWRISLDKPDTWSVCPSGYFLNGLYRTEGQNLHDIEGGYCCKPVNHSDKYGQCYNEKIDSTFRKEGWTMCKRAGYYITGLFRGRGGDWLHNIIQFKCCKMFEGPRLASKFDGGNINQYGIYRKSSKQFNAFSISFWITMSDDAYFATQHASIISHAFKEKGQVHENAPLFFISNKKLSAYFFGTFFRTDIGDIFDGKQHHIMITWQKVDGQLIIYKDSERRYSKTVAKDRPLLAGGIWVVGQDQDGFGVGFQIRNAFKGIIDSVYIWDKILSIDDIKLLAKSCNAYLSGYVIGYYDFEFTSATDLIEATCS